MIENSGLLTEVAVLISPVKTASKANADFLSRTLNCMGCLAAKARPTSSSESTGSPQYCWPSSAMKRTRRSHT